MFNKMNFENYQDYLLSINIAQIGREFGFKKIGMNSLYLLTQILKGYIEDLAVTGKEYCELAGRSEVNMIDVLFSLAERNVMKDDITIYMRETKIKYQFAKQVSIGRIYYTEERERNALIKKINLNNLTSTNAIPENLINSIPRPLRIFPRDFALKETESKVDVAEENKKMRVAIKNLEKKSLEDIISSNNYYDLSKKHTKRKASIDVNNLFSDLVKTENINLGKKFKISSKIDKDIQNLRKEENFMNNLHLNLHETEAGLEKNNLITGNIESELNDKSNYIEDSNL